jgi:hypothetical protein
MRQGSGPRLPWHVVQSPPGNEFFKGPRGDGWACRPAHARRGEPPARRCRRRAAPAPSPTPRTHGWPPCMPRGHAFCFSLAGTRARFRRAASPRPVGRLAACGRHELPQRLCECAACLREGPAGPPTHSDARGRVCVRCVFASCNPGICACWEALLQASSWAARASAADQPFGTRQRGPAAREHPLQARI